MRSISAVFILVFLVFIAISVWQYNRYIHSGSHSVERTKVLMDTLVRIEVFEENEEKGLAAIDTAFVEIERLSDMFSHYDPGSEVSKLNMGAGKPPQHVPPELFSLLQRSVYFSKMIHGSYDATVGVVTRLWDFTSEAPAIPDSEEIRNALGLIDYRGIYIDNEGRAGLTDPGMAVDLGGGAKGYGVDRALSVLKQLGITSALVDGGGDIGLLGSKPDGKPWRIGVQHPRDMQNMIAVIEVDSGSVATSGDYERFFFQSGQRYHHILDPRTGWPARECISATILSSQTVDADILATGVFVLGPEKGMDLINSLPEVEGLIFFEENGQMVHVLSQGLQNRIIFNE